MILVLLVAPPLASVASQLRFERIASTDGDVIWVAARIALPLVLLAFPSGPMQRVGLGLLNVIQLICLLGGLFR